MPSECQPCWKSLTINRHVPMLSYAESYGAECPAHKKHIRQHQECATFRELLLWKKSLTCPYAWTLRGRRADLMMLLDCLVSDLSGVISLEICAYCCRKSKPTVRAWNLRFVYSLYVESILLATSSIALQGREVDNPRRATHVCQCLSRGRFVDKLCLRCFSWRQFVAGRSKESMTSPHRSFCAQSSVVIKFSHSWSFA